MSVAKSVRAKLARKRIGGAKTRKTKSAGATPGAGVRPVTWVVLIALAAVTVFALWMAARESSAPAQAKADVAAPVTAVPAKPVRKPAAPVTRAEPRKTEAAAPVASAPQATIEGCLEKSGEGYRLKDTAGTDAPRARSWKTGFFKKSSAAVTVVAERGVALAAHTGERVSVTGTLADREMRARSLRRLAPSCK